MTALRTKILARCSTHMENQNSVKWGKPVEISGGGLTYTSKDGRQASRQHPKFPVGSRVVAVYGLSAKPVEVTGTVIQSSPSLLKVHDDETDMKWDIATRSNSIWVVRLAP